MASNHDDLEAIKTLIDTLSPFDQVDQQRIIRWACEKLDIPIGNMESTQQTSTKSREHDISISVPPSITSMPSTKLDIKSFVDSKKPSSDMQFVTAVAYYYAFEAPEAQRKDSVESADVQDACRQLGRERLQNPGQTLRNACFNGLLDKAGDRGAYKINTVGENLIAVTLPGGGTSVSPPKKKRAAKKKAAKKKREAKKKAAKKKGAHKKNKKKS